MEGGGEGWGLRLAGGVFFGREGRKGRGSPRSSREVLIIGIVNFFFFLRGGGAKEIWREKRRG